MNITKTVLPALPGIYIFKDKTGTPIYIGKAKSLKKRVASYFNPKISSWKSELLLNEAVSCDHIVTKSENEALILEVELIRTYQPKLNTLLKDGQPFVFLMFSKQELSQLKLVRNKKEPGKYFGPFIYKGQARSVYRFLLESFQLYLCNKKLKNGCLQYHLGKCAGVCTNEFDKEAYMFRLTMAKKILEGKNRALDRQLGQEIKKYNKKLAFEQAQKLATIRANLHNIIQIIKLKIAPKPELSCPVSAPMATNFITLIGLEKEPRIIDCFDISHFQSRTLVGACVRFVDGIPAKSDFRHFAIKTLIKQNDYAALQEIVQRRYKSQDKLPDLILIDGGKGQLNAVQKVAPKSVPIISLAKKEEKIFCAGNKKTLLLDITTPEAKILISLRNYAHHFAISYHRKKRKLI